MYQQDQEPFSISIVPATELKKFSSMSRLIEEIRESLLTLKSRFSWVPGGLYEDVESYCLELSCGLEVEEDSLLWAYSRLIFLTLTYSAHFEWCNRSILTYVDGLLPTCGAQRKAMLSSYTENQFVAFKKLLENKAEFQKRCGAMGAEGVERAGLAGVCALMNELDNSTAVGVALGVSSPNPGATLSASLSVSPRSLSLGVSAALVVTMEGDVAVLGIDYRGLSSPLVVRSLTIYFDLQHTVTFSLNASTGSGGGQLFSCHTIPLASLHRKIVAASIILYHRGVR